MLSYEDIDRPQLKSSEVLIHVHASGVNNADLIQRAGQYEAPEGDCLSYPFPNCLSSYMGHLEGHFGIFLSQLDSLNGSCDHRCHQHFGFRNCRYC